MTTLYRWRYLVLVALLAIAAAVSPGLGGAFVPNNSIRMWFFEDDVNLVAYKAAQEQFGNDEIIAIYFEPPEDVLSPQNLARVRRLTKTLKRIEHVERVFSLTNTQDFLGEDDTLVVRDLLPERPLAQRELARVRRLLQEDPIYAGFFTSGDGRGVMITAQLAAGEEIDTARAQINDMVRTALTAQLEAEGIAYHMGGTGVILTELNRLTTEDANRIVPVSYLLMFLLVLLLLRSGWGLLLAILVVIASAVITMGAFGLFGHQINVLTVVLPTLVIILSIADTVHVVSHCQARAPGGGPLVRQDNLRRLAEVVVPCFLTSLTTAIGLASLGVAKIAAVSELGLFGALGVCVAFGVTFVFAAVLLTRLRPQPHQGDDTGAPPLVDRLLAGAARTVTARPRRVVLAFAGLTVLLLLAFPRIQVDIHTFEYFPEQARARRDHHAINERFGRYLPLEFTLRAKRPEGIHEPRMLEKLAIFQRRVGALPDVGRSISVADLVRKVHFALSGEEDRFPSTRPAVAQELLLYEMADADALDRYLNPAADYTHLFFKFDFYSGNAARALIDEILAIGTEVFGEEGTLEVVGYWPLYLKLVDYALDVQLKGFLIAFGLVLAVMGLSLRSARLTVLAAIPNLFAVLVAGAVLGYGGIDLDFGTATVAAILLGVAVDDTIHFLYAFKRAHVAHPHDVARAVQLSVTGTGRALTSTTVILVLGFLVLALAQVKSVVYFGLLLAICLAAALAADLLLLPALVCLFYHPSKQAPAP
jgi:predicted RND superfamily exporter protein